MKTALIKLALTLGLATLVVSDALPPNDIPLQCVAICGPIVELTADCNNDSKRLKKRRLEQRKQTPDLVGAKVPAHFPREARYLALEQVDGVEEREFSIIVAAPTSFPVQGATTTALDLRPTSTLTRIVPVVSRQSSARDTLSVLSTTRPSTSASTVSTSTPIPSTNTLIASRSMSDDSESPTSSSWSINDSNQDPQGQLSMQGNEEEDCVCLNKSFDVAKVTALCASCVSQAGFPDNNVDIIVDVCNFTALTYSRSQDSVANNVHVKAGASRPKSTGIGATAVVVGLVVMFL